MSVRNFRSVGMVAGVAAAALGCYLVSLRVASERAALEQVETRIVLAQRDIRLLQTEIGTRGRLAQLERWNVKVLALSAPQADQFVDGGFALAKLVAPRRQIDLDAPVVLASAPDPAAGAALRMINADYRSAEPAAGTPIGGLLHQASLKSVDTSRPAPAVEPHRVSSTIEAKAKPKAEPKPAPKLAAALPKPVTPARHAGGTASDPLAPLATPKSPTHRAATKETGAAQ